MVVEAILNPTNDIAFKKIFATEENKDVLLHFLNDVFYDTGRDPIVEVHLMNTAQLPEGADKKMSMLDVLCKDDKGAVFIVEMQVASTEGFEKRAQFYAARAYSYQMHRGDDYRNLKEVVFLGVLDFVMFPNKPGYKSDHLILDKHTHEHDLKDFSYTFLELPKFRKDRIEDLVTYEEKWCYFLKHSDDREEMQKLLMTSDDRIQKAYEALKRHNWTEAELLAYDRVEDVLRDNRARELYVRREAREEGLQEGRLEGRLEGITKVALTMLEQGLPVETIMACTGLSHQQIQALEP
jgi:predicted transposase/invertase (TIGR01784 family)